jgi:CBS domain-containing protein
MAKEIMYPRVSVPAKMNGQELVQKLMCPYPGLPVVNENQEVIGIVSEYDVLNALREGRTIHEFSAESIMSCGHSEHGVCSSPVTVPGDAPIEDIADLMFALSFTVLPVVEGKRLVGLITRKSIINAMAEKGFWHEHEFRKRTP